jgi:calcineurin-like phosphoesterase family protein
MRSRFLTADQHFGHRSIIEYCGRPFATVEEMDEALVTAWNETVGPDDEVWHLGDFALSSKEAAKTTFSRLHGRKTLLILGNHDRRARLLDIGFESVEKEAKADGITLVHDAGEWLRRELAAPMTILLAEGEEVADRDRWIWEEAVRRDYRILCAHIHHHWKVRPPAVNVGVDVWNWRPVPWEEALLLLDAAHSGDGMISEIQP